MSDNNVSDVLRDIVGDVKPKGDEFEVGILSDPGTLCHVNNWISSGVLPLDIIMGGGFPCGRITEIYGDNSTGKSLLAAQAVAEAQRQGYIALFADVESAISVDFMEKIGVDPDKLIYYTPNTIEQLLTVLESTIDSKAKRIGKDHPMVFVWDSVAATTTLTEIQAVREKGIDARYFSPGAIQISAMLRSGLPRKLARNNVAAIFINQVRTNIGVMFGDNVTTYGGKAIGFYSSIRMQLKTKSHIKDAKVSNKNKSDKVIGAILSVNITKNKLFPPYKIVDMPVYFDYGIDSAEATLDLMKSIGLIEMSGSWSTIELDGEVYKWQGKQDWCEVDGIYDTHYEEIAKLLMEHFDLVKDSREDIDENVNS